MAADIPAAPRPHTAAAAVPLDERWQRWIVEQRLRGCTPASMLEVMATAGLDRRESERAVAAVDGDASYQVALRLLQQHRKLESVVHNLQQLWETDPLYSHVEKRSHVSAAEFEARYVRACRPLVLTGHTADWPALRRWSPQDLRQRFGHLEVEVQAERHADVRYEENKLALKRRVQLAAFVDQVVAGGATNDYYLTANNELLRRPEFAPLLDDIGSLPACCDRAQLAASSSFWFGPAGTITPLHHDTIMLFHTQVVGRKRWRLISPLEWPRLYNHHHVYSEVDLERPDLERFPEFAQVKVLEVVVEPGETMFLPLGWWHQVASLDVSLSFSYSNLTLPNRFEYASFASMPAGGEQAAGAQEAGRASTADAMRGDMVHVGPGAGRAMRAEFRDGSTMQLDVEPGRIAVQVSSPDSLAAGHAAQLTGVTAEPDGGFRLLFADGSALAVGPP